MLAVLSPNESLTAVMSGAAATTNPTYFSNWREAGSQFSNSPVGSLSGATAATLVSAPASGQRQIESVQIFNGDTAAVTVTISKVVSGTSTTLTTITLEVGDTLRYDANGVDVVDSSGQSRAAALTAATIATLTTTTQLTSGNVGAAAATGNVATERGNAVVHQTLLTLTGVAMTLADATVGGGVKIYDFPQGRILILGATGTMTFTTTSTLASTLNASVTGNWGVGTVTQANGTLATTEQDIIPTTNFTSSATINVAGSTTSAALAASAQFDGTSTAKDAFLNVGIAGATDIDGDATVTATGTVLITWAFLGDY